MSWLFDETKLVDFIVSDLFFNLDNQIQEDSYTVFRKIDTQNPIDFETALIIILKEIKKNKNEFFKVFFFDSIIFICFYLSEKKHEIINNALFLRFTIYVLQTYKNNFETLEKLTKKEILKITSFFFSVLIFPEIDLFNCHLSLLCILKAESFDLLKINGEFSSYLIFDLTENDIDNFGVFVFCVVKVFMFLLNIENEKVKEKKTQMQIYKLENYKTFLKLEKAKRNENQELNINNLKASIFFSKIDIFVNLLDIFIRCFDILGLKNSILLKRYASFFVESKFINIILKILIEKLFLFDRNNKNKNEFSVIEQIFVEISLFFLQKIVQINNSAIKIFNDYKFFSHLKKLNSRFKNSAKIQYLSIDLLGFCIYTMDRNFKKQAGSIKAISFYYLFENKEKSRNYYKEKIENNK